ncbi:hypothetical protein WA026_004890 [Henosepilachna vigintioctopunctata]|uniref:rRNA-processing protein EBP2 homolog n=1 Tax=Henosepilachna vigintioctopunctata TaxID=420089 RepID=A0AAW1UVE3_9CUCU
MESSDTEMSDSDIELQNAFVKGILKPGLNVAVEEKKYANNVHLMKQKLEEFKLKLNWIERLDCVNKPAPLAPELAVRMLSEEQKRENQLKNNKKLIQYDPKDDPVLNDFNREMLFYRQAQATVMEAIPRIKAMNIPTQRPDDYFAEMLKSDEQMQKIRETLMKKQEQQKQIERVKELRTQRKLGKQLQIQNKLQRQKEKKEILDEVKKVRKGVRKDFDFLDNRKGSSKKSLEKRNMKNKKFGFGGKKRGLKVNTRDSAADISDFKSFKPTKGKKMANKKKQRPGKNRRKQGKSKK